MELKEIKNMKSTSLVIIDDRLALRQMDLATSNKPFSIIYTSNYYEDVKRTALTELSRKGLATCVKSWRRGDYIDDPYGRPYKVGAINCSIWDLRKYFGVTEPLEKFLDYETNAFLKGEISCLI